MESIFFTSWSSLLRVVIIGVGAYIAVVLSLRISGNQSLAKQTAYGFVVTVALGSVLASSILSTDVALADGVAAFAVLLGMQFILSFAGSRAEAVRRVTTNRPIIIMVDGELDERAMLDARVTRDEVLSAVRRSGYGSVEDVAAVVLETEGTLSVIAQPGDSRSALENVRRAGERDGPAPS